MNMFTEDFHPNNDPPEITRQQTDIEESRRSETEHDRRAGIEDEQTEGIPRQVPAHFAVVPDRLRVAGSIEDARHGAVDEHAPEAELAHDLVERALADEELLGHVAHAVEGGADEGEEVAFELVAARDAAEAGTLCDVVAAEEDADAADADEDADDLRWVVAHVEEDGGDEDDHYDGPEVDQLGGEDGSVGLLVWRSC